MKAQEKAHAAHAHGEPHVSSVGSYLKIAGILAVITAIEFGIVYVEALKGIVLPILFVLSALKFGMVAAYFMHLKSDNRMLTWFFVIGIVLAAAILVSLMYIART